jgi:hypothetical protein
MEAVIHRRYGNLNKLYKNISTDRSNRTLITGPTHITHKLVITVVSTAVTVGGACAQVAVATRERHFTETVEPVFCLGERQLAEIVESVICVEAVVVVVTP